MYALSAVGSNCDFDKRKKFFRLTNFESYLELFFGKKGVCFIASKICASAYLKFNCLIWHLFFSNGDQSKSLVDLIFLTFFEVSVFGPLSVG